MENSAGSYGQNTPPSATTLFTYDRRGRLTREARTGTAPYDLEYGYDKGGNRTVKVDHYHAVRTEYHYDTDADAIAEYNSRNNRLMWYATIDTLEEPDVTVSKTYYVYTLDDEEGCPTDKTDGNPTRIITEHLVSEGGGGQQQNAMVGGGGEEPSAATSEVFEPTESVDELALSEGEPIEGAASASVVGGGGSSAMLGGGTNPCGFDTWYTAYRFGYANNGRAVTFVHDESWCSDGISSPTLYTIGSAREFRYDGARARYMNRLLDAGALMNGSFMDIGTTWTDYDGDDAYGDYTIGGSPPTATSTDQYEPGLYRKVSGTADYAYNDHLGTMRRTMPTTGTSSGLLRVFTAFGEKVSGPSDRFGYVGAHGYQSTLDAGAEVFPYLHLGHRYYDPSSGRFLQRDPIGIDGGVNVYSYVGATPTNAGDPMGLWRSDPWFSENRGKPYPKWDDIKDLCAFAWNKHWPPLRSALGGLWDWLLNGALPSATPSFPKTPPSLLIPDPGLWFPSGDPPRVGPPNYI